MTKLHSLLFSVRALISTGDFGAWVAGFIGLVVVWFSIKIKALSFVLNPASAAVFAPSFHPLFRVKRGAEYGLPCTPYSLVTEVLNSMALASKRARMA